RIKTIEEESGAGGTGQELIMWAKGITGWWRPWKSKMKPETLSPSSNSSAGASGRKPTGLRETAARCPRARGGASSGTGWGFNRGRSSRERRSALVGWIQGGLVVCTPFPGEERGVCLPSLALWFAILCRRKAGHSRPHGGNSDIWFAARREGR